MSNQALDHNNEDGETFKQQVCILFRGFDRPTIYVTEGYEWRGFKDNRITSMPTSWWWSIETTAVHAIRTGAGGTIRLRNRLLTTCMLCIRL